MARDLNPRQLRFAQLVASGKRTLVGAFREVYEPSNPKARHVYRNSRRLARHPVVCAKIRELQMTPSLDDAEALQEHAVATLFHLSSPPAGERTRLVAAELLFAISERLQKMHDAAPREEPGVLADLRRLFRRSFKLADTGSMPIRRRR
jgi:hypothetical protein